MRSLGATDVLVLVMFVLLVLDSRRLRSLARASGRGARESAPGADIPPGSDADRVGITLHQIQLRRLVDSEDGGVGWDGDGPEILPVEAEDEEYEDADEVDVFAALAAQFDDLPAPLHRQRTVALDWITADFTRPPARMLECSASSSGTSTGP